MRAVGRSRSEAGFSVVAVVIALTLGLVLTGGLFSLLVSQWHSYRLQREQSDSSTTVRGAAVLLNWELRQVSAGSGDIYAMGANSVTIRATTAGGVVCSYKDVGGANDKRRLGIYGITGALPDTMTADSAVVYRGVLDSWEAYEVTKIWQKTDSWGAPVTPKCFWGDSSISMPRPQAAAEVIDPSNNVDQLEVGAGIQFFQRVEYGLFQQDGRWWLGRRIAGASTWELITGPMRSASDGGLVFTYLDADGNVTAAPADVARIQVNLRSESVGGLPKWGQGINRSVRDSVSTTVFLRN